MIGSLPSYVSSLFILTTFAAIAFLFAAIKQRLLLDTKAAKIIVVSIFFWLVFTAVLAQTGFFLDTSAFPPRFALAGFPTVLFIATIFVFFRRDFINKLPLKTLTLLHIVRIPVEIVLWWLYQHGQIPEIMTFEGRNFDIFAGITAPIMFWLAFRNGKTNKALLTIWNVICLALVSNIVITAILSLPTSFQVYGFDQPNRAVLYFPYIWLPAIVVPIVLFAHLASLSKLVVKS